MPTFSSARLRFFASSRVNAFCPNAFNRVEVFWNSGSDAISFNVSGTKEEDEDEDEEEARVEFFRLSPIIAHLLSQRVAVVLKLVVIIFSIVVSASLFVEKMEKKPHN